MLVDLKQSCDQKESHFWIHCKTKSSSLYHWKHVSSSFSETSKSYDAKTLWNSVRFYWMFILKDDLKNSSVNIIKKIHSCIMKVSVTDLQTFHCEETKHNKWRKKEFIKSWQPATVLGNIYYVMSSEGFIAILFGESFPFSLSTEGKGVCFCFQSNWYVETQLVNQTGNIKSSRYLAVLKPCSLCLNERRTYEKRMFTLKS